MAEGDTDRAAAELRHVLATGAPDELVVPHADAALAVLCAAAGEITEAGRHAERAVDGAAPFELVGIQIMTLVRRRRPTRSACSGPAPARLPFAAR